MKYLLLALLVYVGWRLYTAQKSAGEEAAQSPEAVPPQSPAGAERMVACSHCGIHLPQSEAIAGPESLHFCCNEHRRQHSR